MARINDIVIPSTGPKHKLFGVKFLKHHNMREPMWQAADKMNQYDRGIRMFGENQRRYNQNMRKEILNTKTDKMETAIKLQADYRALERGAQGNEKRVRDTFEEHKRMQRCYTKMLPEDIIENIDHKTFVKRKQLDSLTCLKQKLMDEYQTKLLSLAELQDLEHTATAQQKRDAETTKWLDVEIKATQTRTRTVRTINKAYNMMFDMLHKDWIYYEAVLSALDKDIDEQKMFIKHTMLAGLPALERVQQLKNDYEMWHSQTEKELQIRLKSLGEAYDQLMSNKFKVKHLVRQDSDFELNADRYDRDTASMTNLKTDMKKIHQVIHKLLVVTSVRRPERIFHRMVKQVDINDRLFVNLIKANDNYSHNRNKRDNTRVLRESLFNDLTDAEIKRMNDIERLTVSIRDERQKRKRFEDELIEQDEVMCLIRNAVQHMLDVMRNIGGEIPKPDRIYYPSVTLHLPLLEFSKITGKKKIPAMRVEERPEVLLVCLRRKVDQLMLRYGRERAPASYRKGVNYHIRAINKYWQSNYKPYNFHFDDYLDESDLCELNINKNIPTRTQIKAMSAKIVEDSLKAEDQ